MTKDVYDPTTWPEWPLLHEVLEIVAAHCRAEQAAKELVLQYADRGHFQRYRWGPSAEPETGFARWPEHWGKSARNGTGGNSSCSVDFHNSRVAYVSVLPAIRKVWTLVRLHREDVASMLRLAGFLPARALTTDPPPKQQPSQARKLRENRGVGPQRLRARLVLRRIWHEEYPTRAEVSDVDVWDRFSKEYEKTEGKANPPSRHGKPSLETVLREMGRRD